MCDKPAPQTHVAVSSQEERDMVLASLEAYAIRFAETAEQRRSYQRLSDRLAKAPPQEHVALRSEALEEAAQIAESMKSPHIQAVFHGSNIAAAIRSAINVQPTPQNHVEGDDRG